MRGRTVRTPKKQPAFRAAVILMKAAVLHAEGIAFTPWGIAIVKAVVLGKFVLLGNLAHLGERFTTKPLIWPTLHKALAFVVLLIVLTIIEEAVVGLFHGRSITASLGDLFGTRLAETLAGYLIMLLVLIPFFAFRVLSEALDEGRLERMFFVERRAQDVAATVREIYPGASLSGCGTGRDRPRQSHRLIGFRISACLQRTAVP